MKLAIFPALLFSLGAYAQLLNPTTTLKQAMDKPLKFVGRYVSPSSTSGKISACVFRNDDVTVVYEYCTKTESPAVGVIIYDHATQGQTLQIYAEGTDLPTRIQRKDYFDVFWRVSSRTAPVGFSKDLAAAKFRDIEKPAKFALGCSSFFMEGMGQYLMCGKDIDPAIGESWLEVGNEFWQEPSTEWYEFQAQMRKLVDRL